MTALAEPATAREEQATTVARKARELLELVHDIDPNANVQIGFNLGAYQRDRAMADALIKPLAEALGLEYHHRQGKYGGWVQAGYTITDISVTVYYSTKRKERE